MTNKYEAIGLDMLGDEERARAATVEFAAGTTPEREAEAVSLSQRTGAPVDAVRADPDGARKEAERRRLAALSPTTQRWLTENPNRYALVKDDVGTLDKLGLAIGRTFEASRDFGLSSGWRTLSDHLSEWDNIGDKPDAAPGFRAAPDPFYAEEIARSLFAGYERGVGNAGFVGLPDLRSAETRQAAESVARGLGYESDADYQAARTGGFIAGQERRAQQIERTSEATDQAFAKIAAANETDSVWEALGLVWEGRRAVGTVIGQSLGMGAPGLAMTAATGGTSRLATAATAGGSSGFVEYGASISEALSEAGVDVTDSRAVTAALRNPAIMEKARDRAAKRGVTIALFDAVTAGLAGQLLINSRRGVSSAALRTGGEVGIQAGGGAAGELAAQVVAGDDIKLGDIILEGVAELPFAAVEGRANYVTARERGQVRWINEQLDIVRRSSSGAESLAAATAAAAESNLGQRSPAEAQAFARAAGAEGAVYIDAEVARTLFQSDWQVLVDAVGGDAALTEQLAAGDVAIPADQYFGKIAQLPYAADIARNARVQADALSAVEMESFDIDALADALAGDTSEAAERATPGQPTTRQRVQEDVYGQLISTGRYTDAAAQAQAKLWGAFFASMESRYGADGWAAYEQRMRGIGTAAADGRADPRSTRPWLGDGKLDALLDAIRSDAGPSQSAIMGPSLSAFVQGLGGISDDTGELRGMDAGRLRIGLINAQGVPLDRAREAAAEMGYLPMDSDINDLLDLLDRDLRDGDVFSEQLADRRRVEFETAKSDLQAAIDDNDYLRALSNDEFRALTNQQIADALFGGSMLDQGEPGSFNNPLPESEMESAPVGAWVAGPALPGLDTRRQIMDVPLDRIDATEFDSAGQLAPEKRADAERYAEAMRAGEQFPNGRGSELPSGMIKLQDGHRRFAAARAVGAESMRLAVSPLSLAQAADFDQPASDFESRFGDSKVVDDQGRPLLVYHGTSRDFTEFRMGSAPGWGRGIYFTDNRDQAEADYGGGAGGRVVEAYLSIRNPWRGGFPGYEEVEGTQAWQAYTGSFEDSLDAWNEDGGFAGEVLRELGYDGVIAENSNDIRGLEIVAFDTAQIIPAAERDAQQQFDESAFRPAVVSWAKETYGDAIAPNGRPVWQNFVAWFGESQAVDSAGAPLVVYHGSPDARFMDADATFMSLNDRYGAQQGTGAFWFARDRSTATSYADDRRAFDYQNAEPRIIPAFLALQNPLVVDGGGKPWREAQAIGKTTDVIEKAQAEGHDGVIIRNVRDNYNNTSRTAATDTYVVFNSRQIKSSDANTGNFDPTNASVLNQGQSAVTDNPAFRSWFGESKVVDAEGRPRVVYHGTASDISEFQNGSWFAEDVKLAHGFIGGGRRSQPKARDGSNIVPVYLSIQNPLDLSDRSVQSYMSRRGLLERAGLSSEQVDEAITRLNAGEQVRVRAGLESVGMDQDAIDQSINRMVERQGDGTGTSVLWHLLDNPDLIAELKRAGIDGIKITESITVNPRWMEGARLNRRLNEDVTSATWLAFDPGQIKSATGNTGAFDPSNPNILFQPAFHGTPHDVDRFSLQRIGTGEGRAAFGWGLYFASQRDVADFYRRNLTGIERNIPATLADRALQDSGGDRGRAVADLSRRRDALPEGARGTTQAAIDWLRRGQGTGRLYQVEVPDSDVLLDWDKTIAEQPQAVRDAVDAILASESFDAETRKEWDARPEEARTGRAFYTLLGQSFNVEGERGASEVLLANGVPGLQYLDGDSRNGAEGTHNFVIWDDAAVGEPVRLFQSGDAGVGIESNPNFRRWSNDATLIPADRAMEHEFQSGQKVVVEGFHGTKRPDRIGEQFRRARATSGPMAFFTSDPDIASNYATGKNDTSIDLEENPFESWFKFKRKGDRTATDIIRAWYFLTPEQKDRVFDLAPKVRMDDQAENIILDEDNTTGVGNYDYELQLTQRGYDRRGNPLKALVEGWLNGGTLYDQEGRFMEVLELAGFPVEDVTFDSPYAEFPSVYPVYLAMQSPLVTNDIPQDVVDALNAAAKRDRSRVKYESGVDAWDKNTRTLREWVEQFNEDDSFVWTSIPDKVTKLLADMGYDGIIDVGGKQGGETHRVYIPFGENQVKSQFNRGTYGDTKNIMRQGGQQPAPRGQIQIYPDRSMAISLFETANRSTFLHETGHFFLEVLRDMAAADDAPQQARDDMAALLSWFGVESADQIAVEHHEQFARGFEKYLGEGRAPSPELQSAFSQFKAWLLSVYRSLVNLNVNLTDDVRGVMDRMLAADEEIEAAHVRQGMEPLAFADGVLEEAQIRQYADQLTAATERERAALGARLMAAHDRAARRWYKEQKAEVRKEVEAEYSALPVYRAARALAGAKTFADGTPIPDELRGMKLDRDALVAVYGEAYLQRIRGLYAREGGVDQDVAAMRLGFESGDALLNALANREDMAARVAAETDARMVERYGDPMVDGTLPERAMEAVHGDHRMRVLAWEMAVLEALAADPLAVPDAARPVRAQEGQAERLRPQVSPETRARIREAQGRRTAATRALAEVARRSIAKKTLREIRPNDYLVAERKAAVKAAAASARGSYAEALQAKRQQAFNAAMYRQAKAAQARAESNVRFLRKASSDATRARIGKQAGKFYVDALDAIFHGIEVRGVSRPQVARRAALRDWVRRMQDEGNSTAVPEMLLARVESENVTNLADMTVGDVEGLREAVGNILHLARTKNRLLTAKGQRDWEDVKAEMMDRLEQQPDRHGRTGISDADRQLFARISDLYAAGSNWVLQPETLVEWLDGATTGPFHDLLWDQAQAAERRREALNRAVGGKLQEALDALPAADRKALDRRFHVESLGGDVSGHSILSALLNMGNAGNRDKLTRGGRVVGDEIVPFTPEQLADMFAKLTRPQAEMVQKVWDAIDTLWPEIVALEESMNGIAPERVESTPVTVITRDGPVALRGGYYPAMYDPKGARAGQFSEDEQAKRVLSGQTPIRASTSKGHTEKRTDFAAPLLLDYQAVLTRHLDGVIGDIAYRQFLRQVYKVLGDADIRRMIDNRVGPGAAVGLRKGFERGATGNFSLAGPLLGPFQRVADATMTNLSSAALGFRIPLALANVVAVPLQAAARVPYRYVLRGLRDYYLSGGANLIGNMRRNAEMVQRLSPLMLRRSEARSVELSSIIANLRGQRGFRAKMIEMAMSVHQWTVPLAENAIWMGAYQQAADAGATPTEAVTAADKAIRQTQTKTSAAELSQGEGGYMRMFMQFAGPLVIMNNRMQEAGLRGLRGDVHSWPQALGVWFAVAMGAAWSFELIMGRGPDADDDGEDPDVVDWVAWAAKKLALLPFSAFPMVRDAASYMDSGFSRSTPLVESMKSVIDTFGGLAESLFGDEEVDAEKVTKQAVRAAGVATGVPSNQLLRTGDYLMSVSTGEHEMGNPAAEAYYLVQGAPDED